MKIVRGQRFVDFTGKRRIEIYEVNQALNSVIYIENKKLHTGYIDVLQRRIKDKIWSLEDEQD